VYLLIGMYHTTLGCKEDAAFFSQTAGQAGRYQIVLAYRPGGPPTYIEDMTISGPMNFESTFHNLVAVKMQNTNGFYFKVSPEWTTCWLAACCRYPITFHSTCSNY
jgi:hypothetical protein